MSDCMLGIDIIPLLPFLVVVAASVSAAVAAAVVLVVVTVVVVVFVVFISCQFVKHFVPDFTNLVFSDGWSECGCTVLERVGACM